MNEKTLFLTVSEVQKQYLPMGKKKIRKILTCYPHEQAELKQIA